MLSVMSVDAKSIRLIFLAVDKPIRLACVLVQCSPKPVVYIVFNQPVKVSVCVCACDCLDWCVSE